jgi:hypothetical protein
MHSEDKFWSLFWLLIISGLVGIAWAVAWGITITSRTAMERGYHEVECPSMMTTKWVSNEPATVEMAR